MKRVVVSGPNDWAIEEATVTPPGVGEVLLRPISVGICGGDVHLLAGKNAVASYPLVLGHECVAVVDEAGAGVDLEPGAHVAIYPTVSCGECQACRSGRNNQCREMRTMGLANPNGCFTESLTVSADHCIPISAEVAARYGAVIEPTAVGCHATARAGVTGGESILVIGVGAIGTAVGAVASARGAASVAGVDRFPTREGIARQLGFSEFSTASGEELRGWLSNQVGSLDVVFDTVGSDETTRVALESLRPGGRYVALASSKPGQILQIPYEPFFLKELEMISARNYRPADFEDAAALLAEEAPALDLLITGRYPLEGFERAVADLTGNPKNHIKMILEPNPSL